MLWQHYYQPSSLDQALQLLQQHAGSARIVAGGTDVLVELQRGVKPTTTLIDITRLHALKYVRHAGGMIQIGGLATHNDVIASDASVQYALPLAQACWEVGAPQIRTRATIAGNLITASPANDAITPLMALGAEVVLLSAAGERTVPLRDFYTSFRKTVIQPDELLREIRLPALQENQRGLFIKLGLRRAQAISVIDLASVLTMGDGGWGIGDGTDSPSPIPHPPSPNYVPTNAGLLLFGKDVERFFPQCEVTLVRYRGREMGDEFLREDIRDTLVETVRRAEIWLSEHMRRGSRMIGLERQDWAQFPQGALREALVNAVAHRDYTIRGEGIRIALFGDRMECYSPGRLPGHVTVENIAAERFSRNETLVQVLADYGLIERLGYGIDRMLRQMSDAALPPPEFRETAAGFLVMLRGQAGEDRNDVAAIDTREWRRMGLNERQIGALLHLAEQRRITNSDIQELAPDVSPETIRRDLADLVERGLLLKIGEKRGAYYILK
jgi:CO/xanthine dehydrogenase FAD-binding subunit